MFGCELEYLLLTLCILMAFEMIRPLSFTEIKVFKNVKKGLTGLPIMSYVKTGIQKGTAPYTSFFLEIRITIVCIPIGKNNLCFLMFFFCCCVFVFIC